ncbi:hypothetical protein BC937DRAFT_92998 [Endogone sp. FLAS-F59071]|nr:hypothetical protein BC937DRAFT_92998 [Endogone sp. FLAS-F59071]|eukprot:RUS23043.1 hypothetical protein BC937DRAFT_92998 [Endogone sp. FLAS-F59071]
MPRPAELQPVKANVPAASSDPEAKQPLTPAKSPNPTVDDLSDLLAASLHASSSVQNRQQDFKALHKSLHTPLLKSKEESQEYRRQKALELQKENRRNITDHARRIALFKASDPLSEEEEEEGNEEEIDEDEVEPELSQSKSSKRRLEDEREEASEDGVQRSEGSEGPDRLTSKKLKSKGRFRTGEKRKKKNPYANQVMYAEWMAEVPSDLDKNWCAVVCPVGKRCLVTSANGSVLFSIILSLGKTVARLRNANSLVKSAFPAGRIFNTFSSVLPAGSQNYRGNRSTDYCILDCIFDPVQLTYYVLDMMCWKGHPVYDCETEFRFYWLQTKLAELDHPTASNSFYKFRPLFAFEAHRDQLRSLIVNPGQCGYPIRPDGILFYNRHTQYVIGITPLVCWVSMDKAAEILMLGEVESGGEATNEVTMEEGGCEVR